jgi:anti-anti-sigma factor
LTIDVETRDGATIVRPFSRMDAMTSPEVGQSLSTAVAADQPKIVLDLSQCPFVSSAGLRVILQAAKGIKGRGKMAICGLKGPVKQVFDLAGIDRVVPIIDGLDQALIAVQ